MYIQYIDKFLNVTALCNQTNQIENYSYSCQQNLVCIYWGFFLLYFIILHPLSYQIFILLSILTPDPLNLRSASRG